MGHSQSSGVSPTTVRPASGVRAPALSGRHTAGGLAPGARGGARVSHPDRVIDSCSGSTKGELAAYYGEAAAAMRPHLRARPVSLLRAPAGVEGPSFFQRHADTDELSGLDRLDTALYPGHEPLLAIPSKAALMSAVQMNVIEFHTWNSTTRSIDRPDRMLFDLDPGEGVAWGEVLDGAARLHAFLQELGLASFLKTSGGAGLHVVVPLRPAHGWETVKLLSRSIVAQLAGTNPERFVLRSGPKNRVGRIFIDYLRNGLGATTVCAWSVRARPGLGVSVPVDWQELSGLTSGAHWTLANVRSRLRATGNTVWKTYASSRQGLGAALKSLNIDPGDVDE